MAVATAERSQLETWRNMTAGRVVIRRIDGRGNFVDEIISGHKTFNLTPEERRLNQDRAATEDLDHFTNGMLAPVRLIDGVEDTEALRTNPNHLAESDLKSLFKSKGEKFADAIEGIRNPITLQRLLDMSVELDATVGQHEAVKARLAAVNPDNFVGQAAIGSSGEIRTEAPQGRQRQNKGSDGIVPDGQLRPITPK